MPKSGLPPDVAGTVVTVGTFDGVHRGHQDVVARLVQQAGERGLRSLLVTFDPHPLEVLNPDAAPRLLTTPRERLEILASSGLDYVAVLPFSRTLAAYEADQFVDLVLRDRFRMRELLIGHDHGFGRGRAGDAATLVALGRARGFDVDVVPPVASGAGEASTIPISSSGIRRALELGEVSAARGALGRWYSVSGVVTHGEKRGRQIGYPTLNVVPDSPRKLLPREGVYAVYVQTPDGPKRGMMNVGSRPTFGDETVVLEAHLFDTHGDWYGARVRLDLVARLRDVEKFPSIDALVAQLRRDGDAARTALDEAHVDAAPRRVDASVTAT